ncbi:PF10088 domain protein [Escherichia coli 97.0246]|uniref:PF10088 domain protein n=1 Tax=Escherichia coli 97.0246 TaxID=869670 RepID=A0A8E0FPC0_ECOLX|nr:PF10088 domain protein [Escherichia coli 97.0246]
MDKIKLKRPTFVIHDSIEDVDVNQIRDIFFEANNINGQYIVSILSDKFSEDADMKMMMSNSILELSSTNKFFKV